MKVWIDQDLCTGDGLCEEIAPDVFVGLDDGLFPLFRSIDVKDELEEERRLFYVALTRAQKEVNLSYVLNRYRWGKLIDSDPSRFIDEIEDDYINMITPTSIQRPKMFFNNVNKSGKPTFRSL